MSVRKRAAGAAASPELDTPDPVKKRKKNDVSNLVALMCLAILDTAAVALYLTFFSDCDVESEAVLAAKPTVASSNVWFATTVLT